MPPKHPQVKQRPALDDKECTNCGRTFNARGYGMHKKKCHPPPSELPPAIDIEGDIDPGSGGSGTLRTHLSNQRPDYNFQIADNEIQITENVEGLGTDVEEFVGPVEADGDGEYEPDGIYSDSLTSGLTGLRIRTPNAGDIVIQYHPNSKKGTHILTPEEFKASLKDDSEPIPPPDDEPWRPFRSREDFEFAELAKDAALNRRQIERMMKLIQRCQDGPAPLTFENYNDFKDSLENASKLLTKVTI